MNGYDVNHSPALEGCRDRCARLEAENAELRAALERIERMTSPDNKGWASDTTRLDHAHLIAQYALGLLPHQQEDALRAALAATEGEA
ncbi:MAG: hypothetical protein WDA03_13355 [Trueperaceae bacterium]